MKKALCIIASAILLSLCIVGCSERGKIGNGKNGTISDNSSLNATNPSATNAAAGSTESTTVSTDEGSSNKDKDRDGNDNDNDNDRPNENGSQQGVAGEKGDAIDDGISDIEGNIMGTEDNTDNNNSR